MKLLLLDKIKTELEKKENLAMRPNNIMKLKTQKMTMDALKKGIREILSFHVDDLWEIYETDDNYEELDENKVIDLAMKDIITPKLLKYINENLKVQPVAELQIYDENITDILCDDENDIEHNVNLIEKLFDVPTCLIGMEEWESSLCRLNTFHCCCVFLTVDGDLKYATCDEIYDEDDIFKLTVYKKSKRKCYDLNMLEDFLNKDLQEVLLNY